MASDAAMMRSDEWGVLRTNAAIFKTLSFSEVRTASISGLTLIVMTIVTLLAMPAEAFARPGAAAQNAPFCIARGAQDASGRHSTHSPGAHSTYVERRLRGGKSLVAALLERSPTPPPTPPDEWTESALRRYRMQFLELSWKPAFPARCRLPAVGIG